MNYVRSTLALRVCCIKQTSTQGAMWYYSKRGWWCTKHNNNSGMSICEFQVTVLYHCKEVWKVSPHFLSVFRVAHWGWRGGWRAGAWAIGFMVCAVQEVMQADPVFREHTQEAVTPGSTLITNKRISHNIPQIAQEHITSPPGSLALSLQDSSLHNGMLLCFNSRFKYNTINTTDQCLLTHDFTLNIQLVWKCYTQ